MTLNLSQEIKCAFAADISKCFEAIPITPDDPEGLPQALNWMVTTAFKQYAAVHHVSHPVLPLPSEPQACSNHYAQTHRLQT
jgi:hypothetical protein